MRFAAGFSHAGLLWSKPRVISVHRSASRIRIATRHCCDGIIEGFRWAVCRLWVTTSEQGFTFSETPSELNFCYNKGIISDNLQLTSHTFRNKGSPFSETAYIRRTFNLSLGFASNAKFARNPCVTHTTNADEWSSGRVEAGSDGNITAAASHSLRSNYKSFYLF